MNQVTSAMAAKLLRKLNDQRDALLAMEKKAKTFTAAIQEDIESVRPAYDYKATQDALLEIEAKIRKLKHTLNCFNSTYVIPGFDMTIDQMLIYIPQLTARKKKLDSMRSKLPKERVREVFNRGSNIIEYSYSNYDIVCFPAAAGVSLGTKAEKPGTGHIFLQRLKNALHVQVLCLTYFSGRVALIRYS